jgi:hypothetical protein
MDRVSKASHFDGSAAFSRAALAALEEAPAMGCVGRGRLRTAIGRHQPHFPGRRRGTPPVGRAVIALSAEPDRFL